MYLPTSPHQPSFSHSTLDATTSSATGNPGITDSRLQASSRLEPFPRHASSRRNAWKHKLSYFQLRVLGIVAPQSAARRGIEIFCTPAADTTASWACDDVGAHLSMLKVDSHHLGIYLWGDTARQPYVLLAHDWGGHSLQHLEWVKRLLDAGYAVVAFDQQAHGRSDGCKATLPDFVCNLLAVGWRHGRAAAVIGHGLGGTAAALALKHGLEADRAILIAAQADPEEAITRFTDALGLAAVVRQRMIALLEAETGVPMEDLQAHRNVPQLGRPALLVHDVEDREVPWSDSERYARHWPHSRLLSTSGLGHHDVASDAQVISAGIDFLAGAPVGERVVGSPNLPYGFA